jgi:16S rRNA (cytosine1402-N4)-methyltransferase
MKKYKPKSGERIERQEEMIPPKVELPFKFAQEHEPVLWQEVLAAFYPQKKVNHPSYLDGTFGRGGHYRALQHVMQNLKATALDQDLAAIEYAKENFAAAVSAGALSILHTNFADFAAINKDQFFDMILLDLGVSSPQLDQAERGFSFYHNGPLDMRMNQTQVLTAEFLVNTCSEEELLKIFRDYGEVYRPGRVVRAIVHDRKEKAFQTTAQLAGLIERVDGWMVKGHHPATKYFMALRLAVNSELEVVAKALPKMINFLKPRGRLAVISFHSLEDRIVKNIFRESENFGRSVYKKVIGPTQEECDRNSRARSAKLRVFERSAQDELEKV